MLRTARESSLARADSGITSSPSRPRRNKRNASQALPPTPPRTVKRERKRRIRGRPPNSASKQKSPTRSRCPGLETVLEESDEPEEEIALGTTQGRRLDFGPAAKRRRLEEVGARLDTLLDSPHGQDAENPFWDGLTKAKASDVAEKAENDIIVGNTKCSEKRKNVDVGDSSKKDEPTEKIVRVRSPSPPLLSFRGKAPVSPPPSNRRKKKVRGKITIESVVEEEKTETEGEPSTKAVVEGPSEATGELSVKLIVEPTSETSEVQLQKPTVEAPSESTQEHLAKSSVEPESESAEEASLKDELPVVDLLPMPSTPKKGKKRMDSPIRDSSNNPFLDDSPTSVSGEPEEPRTPTIRGEKPTITYVFRGVRAEFANPMYNLPPEVHERSLLPMEHPDYSPDPACPPKRLFTRPRRRQASPSPTRRGKSKPETRSRAAASSTSQANAWDDSDDEAELHITPPKRLFH